MGNCSPSRCHCESTGWFGGDEVGPVFWPQKSKWYWAKDQALEQIVGVGMFMLQNDEWTFWINGTCHRVQDFDFAEAKVPACLEKTHGNRLSEGRHNDVD